MITYMAYGHEFSVLTDNNPLTYVLTSAKLDSIGHRWLAALAAYNFTLKCRPGNLMQMQMVYRARHLLKFCASQPFTVHG